MEGGEFVFDYVHLLNCKCRKLNSHCGESNVDSSDWIIKQEVAINPIKKKKMLSKCCNSRIKS